MLSNLQNKDCINLKPRGYTDLKLFISKKEFVKLQRPPPVSKTLLKTLELFSNSFTFAVGFVSFARIAEKKPAAPPPIIAIFFI